MKKIIKISVVFMLFLLTVFVAGCFGDGTKNNNNNNNNNNPDTPKAEGWYFLDNLNYNPNFSSYGEGQGFLLYDEIDFNSVQFSSDVDEYTVKFDISCGEETNIVVTRGFGGFETYLFEKTGQYNVKVSAKDEDSEDLEEGRFSFGVAVGNRPDRVEYTIKNSKNETVEHLKGGDSYTISAKLFCQQNEYTTTSADVYWGTPGTTQGVINLQGNIAREQTRNNNFFFFIRNNLNSRIRIFEGKPLNVYDNLIKTEEFPQGIYYSYDKDIIDGKLPLDVNVGQGNRCFYQDISAEYRFDNGDVQSIELSDTRAEGKLGMFISYDDETPEIYSVKNYDYSVDAHGDKRAGYFSNGVKYQFDPTKSGAKIYLAVWSLENNQYVTTKIDGTDVDLQLVSEAPTPITLTVSGSHKNDTAAFSTGYKEFSKSPQNGTVDVYLCCDMDGDNSIEDEYQHKTISQIYQYFVLNVSIGGDLKDYTVLYTVDRWDSPAIESLHSESQPFFVAPNIGSSTITVKSMFLEHEYTLTVNVIDKIFDNAKRIHKTTEAEDFAVFSTVDLRGFLKMKEYRLSDYNDDSFTLRNLREDEVFDYSIINGVDFNYANNGYRGKEIKVTLHGTNKYTTFSKVYIIPDFEFKVNDVLYTLKELTETREYVEDIDSLDHSQEKRFFGRIPILTVEGESIVFEITNEDEMEDRTDIPETMPSEPRYTYSQDDDRVVVTYLFYYTLGEEKQVYEVEILNIQLA